MADIKVRNKKTGEVFTIRKKQVQEESTKVSPSQQGGGQDASMEKLNILGLTLNAPGAAIRSQLQGTGYMKGVTNPSEIPTFQDLSVQGMGNMLANQISKIPNETMRNVASFVSTPLNIAASGFGMAADVATNPADVVGLFLGKAPGMKQLGAKVAGSKVGKAVTEFATKQRMPPDLKKLFKFDNVMKQSEQAKLALDTNRSILGKAKELAIKEVENVNATLDWSKAPKKVVAKLANQDFGVVFDKDGKVINTIGNLDKAKLAIGDLLTSKDYVEAGTVEKGLIKNFAGKVKDAMVKAANDAKKPDLAKALEDYHNFMDNYDLINSHLTDKFGNAMANKMKSTFRLRAEPVVKRAWSNIAKTNPEIRGIVNSRNNRELLKLLLKTTAIGVPGAATGLGIYNKLKD
jgi:hypothetical protein